MTPDAAFEELFHVIADETKAEGKRPSVVQVSKDHMLGLLRFVRKENVVGRDKVTRLIKQLEDDDPKALAALQTMTIAGVRLEIAE